MIAGYYYYFGLLHVSRGLRRVGRDPADRSGVLRKLLLKEQLQDGSWKDVEAGGKSCGTALALLSLDELGTILWIATTDEAIAASKESARPVLVFLTDGKKDASDTEKAMRDPAVLELLQGFACVRVAIAKDDPVCRKTKITYGCAILVVDPRAEDPLDKPLKKWTGMKSAKKLKEDLGKTLKEWK
jgi:hypothetical protein